MAEKRPTIESTKVFRPRQDVVERTRRLLEPQKVRGDSVEKLIDGIGTNPLQAILVTESILFEAFVPQNKRPAFLDFSKIPYDMYGLPDTSQLDSHFTKTTDVRPLIGDKQKREKVQKALPLLAHAVASFDLSQLNKKQLMELAMHAPILNIFIAVVARQAELLPLTAALIPREFLNTRLLDMPQLNRDGVFTTLSENLLETYRNLEEKNVHDREHGLTNIASHYVGYILHRSEENVEMFNGLIEALMTFDEFGLDAHSFLAASPIEKMQSITALLTFVKENHKVEAYQQLRLVLPALLFPSGIKPEPIISNEYIDAFHEWRSWLLTSIQQGNSTDSLYIRKFAEAYDNETFFLDLMSWRNYAIVSEFDRTETISEELTQENTWIALARDFQEWGASVGMVGAIMMKGIVEELQGLEQPLVELFGSSIDEETIKSHVRFCLSSWSVPARTKREFIILSGDTYSIMRENPLYSAVNELGIQDSLDENSRSMAMNAITKRTRFPVEPGQQIDQVVLFSETDSARKIGIEKLTFSFFSADISSAWGAFVQIQLADQQQPLAAFITSRGDIEVIVPDTHLTREFSALHRQLIARSLSLLLVTEKVNRRAQVPVEQDTTTETAEQPTTSQSIRTLPLQTAYYVVDSQRDELIVSEEGTVPKPRRTRTRHKQTVIYHPVALAGREAVVELRSALDLLKARIDEGETGLEVTYANALSDFDAAYNAMRKSQKGIVDAPVEIPTVTHPYLTTVNKAGETVPVVILLATYRGGKYKWSTTDTTKNTTVVQEIFQNTKRMDVFTQLINALSQQQIEQPIEE